MEYINEGYYTHSGNGLGCFYTMHYACPERDNRLWLIHDMYYGDMYLVTYTDGFVLNRSEKYAIMKNIKDLHIMEKYDTNKIISTLKYRNKYI